MTAKREPVGLLGGHRLPDQTEVGVDAALLRDAVACLRRWRALDCAAALGLEVCDAE